MLFLLNIYFPSYVCCQNLLCLLSFSCRVSFSKNSHNAPRKKLPKFDGKCCFLSSSFLFDVNSSYRLSVISGQEKRIRNVCNRLSCYLAILHSLIHSFIRSYPLTYVMCIIIVIIISYRVQTSLYPTFCRNRPCTL